MKYIPEAVKEKQPDPSELSRIYYTVKRIVWSNDKIKNPDGLLKEKDCQVMLANDPDKCLIEPGGAILVDFGTEMCASVRLIVNSMENSPDFKADIRVRFGESCGEAMAELGYKGACNDHIPRDITAKISGLSMTEFGPTGFRFLRIDNLSSTSVIGLSSVIAIATLRDIEYKGSFISNDSELNRIYNTAAYTLHLCMQDYIWDGIKRDRLVWIGDMYPEIASLCSIFGYDESVEKTLDNAKMQYPIPNFMNGIITYSAWWIFIQYEWYMHNGRKEYLKEQHTYLKELVKLFGKRIKDDGSLELSDTRALFDWPSYYDEVLTNSGIHSVIKSAFEKAAFLLSELEDGENAALCRDSAERMSKAILPDLDYKQIAAMHVYAGMKDAKKENERLLSKNGASGISTFLGMFTYEARTLAGDTEGALENIRGLYGKMLSVGATSFWEDFDPAWCEGAGRIDELTPDGLCDIHGDRGAHCYVGFRHSLCHGWSSGVCAYLSKYVLGVYPVKPGCREVVIAPSLGDLTDVRGTYPTPFGTISLHHVKNADGTVKTEYSAPKEIEIILK